MTYTVFRNSRLRDFYCAIPLDRPVPPGLCKPFWSYECTTTPDKPRPSGFDEKVARFAVSFQGFYTFRERTFLERWAERKKLA